MKIAIYVSRHGTTQETRKHVKSFVSQFFRKHEIVLMKETDILDGKLDASIDYFFMPGGATLPMLKAMPLTGFEYIKKYVENGGSYIGLCAGAYLASDYVDFQSEQLSMYKKHPLGFYPGVQKGPYVGHYNAEDNQGFRCVDIQFENCILPAYLNGGGYFVNPEHFINVEVLARYNTGEACIVKCEIGKGNAYLMAVHLEYQPQLLIQDNYIHEADINRLKFKNVERFELWRKILNV